MFYTFKYVFQANYSIGFKVFILFKQKFVYNFFKDYKLSID